MTYEFEGKTEREALDSAVSELGLERDQFDIEVLENQKSGFLGIGKRVRIRVHLNDVNDDRSAAVGPSSTSSRRSMRSSDDVVVNPSAENDFEHGVVEFLETLTAKMGNPATATVLYREQDKVAIRLDSENNARLIGKKGATLDAIQTLANIVGGRIGGEGNKIVVDSENYRNRREEQLVRLAEKVGDEVKQSRKSRLLEPMNPFERRLIHTTLSSISGIGTKSEGDGLYKQVRIYYKG